MTRIRTAKDMGVKMDIIAAEDERTCQAVRTYDGKAFKPDEAPATRRTGCTTGSTIRTMPSSRR